MDHLESYKVLQCASKGQYSEVYHGTHEDSGTPVAIKRIKIFDMHPTTRKEAETEVGLLQALDHPHLIKYHEHFQHDGDLYVVMEWGSGGTLAQRIDNARRAAVRLEEGQIWRWLSDVASALAYLHNRRVLHRDVKPAHIFLGCNGAAKLGDFGLSKAMSPKTQCAFSCVGTPLYMSPEIVKGEGYAFGSDVWSLGCTWYELAMGLPPFHRSDMDFYALGEAICTARYPAMPIEHWSRELIELVDRILTVDPSRRPQAQQVLDAAGCKLVPRIQDFEILGTIGHGKFSEVHRSKWHSASGGDREVALKRIQFFEMDSEARRECKAEVNMLKRLDHSTIIKYLDSFIEGSELVIVLELAPHGDLANLCRQLKQDRRNLAEQQVWAIFFQVADALLYMHKNRIMHRDIKPANIFMCSQGAVKLGDLGLGRYFSSNTYRAHSVVGTPFYMSPEVITSSEGYSFKSDVWSLGCVLYELAALSSPFASSRLNFYALGNQIRSGSYPPLPESTSSRVRDLVTQMIQVNCDARRDALAVFDAARRHLLQCAPPSAGDVGPAAAGNAGPAAAAGGDEPRLRGLQRAEAVVREMWQHQSLGSVQCPGGAAATGPAAASPPSDGAYPNSRCAQSVDARRVAEVAPLPRSGPQAAAASTPIVPPLAQSQCAPAARARHVLRSARVMSRDRERLGQSGRHGGCNGTRRAGGLLRLADAALAAHEGWRPAHREAHTVGLPPISSQRTGGRS